MMKGIHTNKEAETLGEYTGYISIFSSEIEERRIPLSGATGDGTSGNPILWLLLIN